MTKTNGYKKPENIYIVPINDLNVHYATDNPIGYQREPTPSLLIRMKTDGFDEDLSPVIDVVERVWQNNDIYIVDGGTRFVGAKRQGTTHMICKFHPEVKTYEQEAKLFYDLNKKRSSVPSYNQYNSRLQYHDTPVIKIDHLITKCGFTIGKKAGYRILGGPSRLEELMRGNPVALEKALYMLNTLCEPCKYPAVEGLLRGLYYIAANSEDENIFNKNSWVYKRLIKVGPEMLNKYCNEQALAKRGRSTMILGQAIIEQINYRASGKNKLVIPDKPKTITKQP